MTCSVCQQHACSHEVAIAKLEHANRRDLAEQVRNGNLGPAKALIEAGLRRANGTAKAPKPQKAANENTPVNSQNDTDRNVSYSPTETECVLYLEGGRKWLEIARSSVERLDAHEGDAITVAVEIVSPEVGPPQVIEIVGTMGVARSPSKRNPSPHTRVWLPTFDIDPDTIASVRLRRERLT